MDKKKPGVAASSQAKNGLSFEKRLKAWEKRKREAEKMRLSPLDTGRYTRKKPTK